MRQRKSCGGECAWHACSTFHSVLHLPQPLLTPRFFDGCQSCGSAIGDVPLLALEMARPSGTCNSDTRLRRLPIIRSGEFRPRLHAPGSQM